MNRSILLASVLLILPGRIVRAQSSGSSPVQTKAQYVPAAPIAPKTIQECSAFEAEVSAFKNEKIKEHDICRYHSGHQVDRPGSIPTTVCAVSACQELHDWAYGDAAAGLDQEVAACRAALGDYQARVARAQQLAAGRQQALQGATTNIAAALGTLMSKDAAQPLDSQNQLSDYDTQKQKEAVVGDDDDPSLKMNDDLGNLAASKDKPTTQDTLGQDLDKLDDGKSKDSDPSNLPPACDELISYRDKELEGEFNVALAQRDIYKDGEAQQFDLAGKTLNLMNDHWWRSETIAKVAIEVKFVTDEANAFLSLFVPEAKATDPKWVKLLGQPPDIVGHAGTAIGIIRSDVENGARKASEDGSKAAVWTLADALNPLIAMSHGVIEHAENEEELEKYRGEVQKQVAAIVRTARNMHDKAKEAQSKADSITMIKQDITDYCSAQPAINLIPK
jgi:hypothetical protein